MSPTAGAFYRRQQAPAVDNKLTTLLNSIQ